MNMQEVIDDVYRRGIIPRPNPPDPPDPPDPPPTGYDDRAPVKSSEKLGATLQRIENKLDRILAQLDRDHQNGADAPPQE